MKNKAICLSTFLDQVKSGTIPTAPPDVGTTSWWEQALKSAHSPDYDTSVKWSARDVCTKRGMWAIVDKQWTKKLARWIGKREVLEIMAGRGWLARALSEHGVKITATDSGEWGDRHSEGGDIFPILYLDAVTAVKTIRADVLLVSWPPYGENAIFDACNEWGQERPVVYIGESDKESLFDNFIRDEAAPEIVIPQWYGLHDGLMIGTWGG